MNTKQTLKNMCYDTDNDTYSEPVFVKIVRKRTNEEGHRRVEKQRNWDRSNRKVKHETAFE